MPSPFLQRLLTLPPTLRQKCFEAITSTTRCYTVSTTLRANSGHENPLGLPKSGTPPNLAARMKRGLPEKRPIPNVAKVIAVSSAKGGVGKSTIAVNLALALARQQSQSQSQQQGTHVQQRPLHIGILDTDIYGPSLPTLLNLESYEPHLDGNSRLIPLTAYGIHAMSMGFLVPAAQPLAWRGLMLQKALTQLLFEVSWPALDVLVIDLPPGTGDVQLTLTQSVPLAGAVIVSTPQDLALRDAVRGVAMLDKVGVPILGLVQNMSTFVCANCGHVAEIFGRDGAKHKCEELGIPFLGDVPLHPDICSSADVGKPTMASSPDSPQAQAFVKLASTIASKLQL